MTLSEQALDALYASRNLRYDVAKELNFSEEWVKDRMKQNKSNGPLTSYAVVELIARHLGLEELKDLLVDEGTLVVSTE